MWKDPVVEETRKRRESYASQFGNDLAAIVADIQRRQEQASQKPVTLAQRKPRNLIDVA